MVAMCDSVTHSITEPVKAVAGLGKAEIIHSTCFYISVIEGNC